MDLLTVLRFTDVIQRKKASSLNSFCTVFSPMIREEEERSLMFLKGFQTVFCHLKKKSKFSDSNNYLPIILYAKQQHSKLQHCILPIRFH